MNQSHPSFGRTANVHTKATDTLETVLECSYIYQLFGFTHSFIHSIHVVPHFTSFHPLKKNEAKTKTVIYCYSYGYLLVFLGIFVKTLC